MKSKFMLCLCLIVSLVFVLSLSVGCQAEPFAAEPTPTPTQTPETTPTPSPSPSPTPQPTPSPSPSPTPEPLPTPTPTPNADTVGMIIGEMYYKDIDVADIMENPFKDVLGEPLRTEGEGSFNFYKDFEIVATTTNSFTFTLDMVLHISSPNLNMFTINGITLDKPWSELIDIFGEPMFSDPINLSYYITLNSIVYHLAFWFGSFDEIPTNFSIDIILF